MSSRVFEVVDDEDRVLFFLVKSARGGPLESVVSQFSANAVARHEDGEFMWAIKDTEEARVMVELIVRDAGIALEKLTADIEVAQAARDTPVLASVAPPGTSCLFFALGADGELVTEVLTSRAAVVAWLGRFAPPSPSIN